MLGANCRQGNAIDVGLGQLILFALNALAQLPAFVRLRSDLPLPCAANRAFVA